MRPVLRDIRITYIALLGIQLILGGSVYYFLQQNEDFGFSDVFPFQLAVPTLLISGLAIIWTLNRTRTRQARQLNISSFEKIRYYKTTVLLRSTVLEGINIFIILAALVTGQIQYLIYFLVGLAAFLYFRPKQTELDGLYGIG